MQAPWRGRAQTPNLEAAKAAVNLFAAVASRSHCGGLQALLTAKKASVHDYKALLRFDAIEGTLWCPAWCCDCLQGFSGAANVAYSTSHARTRLS